jgi:hypothetical protein
MDGVETRRWARICGETDVYSGLAPSTLVNMASSKALAK